MDPFYSTSGSSPPKGRDPAGHNLHLGEQESHSPLPEELVETLAVLLAEALVNDIRQYPDLGDLTLANAPVAAARADTRSHEPSRRRPTSTRSSTRRPAHAS